MAISWTGPILYELRGIGDAAYTQNSGVYLIAEKSNYREVVRYVGQAENIRDRMVQHRSSREENNRLKKLMNERIDNVRVYFTQIHDAVRRNNLEFTVFNQYSKLRNLYNERTPTGILIDNINFPI